MNEESSEKGIHYQLSLALLSWETGKNKTKTLYTTDTRMQQLQFPNVFSRWYIYIRCAAVFLVFAACTSCRSRPSSNSFESGTEIKVWNCLNVPLPESRIDPAETSPQAFLSPKHSIEAAHWVI